MVLEVFLLLITDQDVAKICRNSILIRIQLSLQLEQKCASHGKNQTQSSLLHPSGAPKIGCCMLCNIESFPATLATFPFLHNISPAKSTTHTHTRTSYLIHKSPSRHSTPPQTSPSPHHHHHHSQKISPG